MLLLNKAVDEESVQHGWQRRQVCITVPNMGTHLGGVVGLSLVLDGLVSCALYRV